MSPFTRSEPSQTMEDLSSTRSPSITVSRGSSVVLPTPSRNSENWDARSRGNAAAWSAGITLAPAGILARVNLT